MIDLNKFMLFINRHLLSFEKKVLTILKALKNPEIDSNVLILSE